MTLNASGQISLIGTTAGQSIEVELGGNGTTTLSLTNSAVRTLAGVPSGPITMPTNFWGKSNYPLVNGFSAVTAMGTATDFSPYSVAVSSSDIFVAVGIFVSSQTMGYSYSTDGKVWSTPASMPGSPTNASARCVVWNAGTSSFIAFGTTTGAGGTLYKATSTNGSTWTTPTATTALPLYTCPYMLIPTGPNSFYGIAKTLSSYASIYSNDAGATFTYITASLSGISPSGIASTTGGLGTILGTNNTGSTTSNGGVSWVTANVGSGNISNGLTYIPSGKKLILFTYFLNGSSYGTGYKSSSDGVTWSAEVPFSGGVNNIMLPTGAISTAIGQYVCVGYELSTNIARFSISNDFGVTWSQPSNFSGGSTINFAANQAIAINSKGLVVVVARLPGTNTGAAAYSI